MSEDTVDRTDKTSRSEEEKQFLSSLREGGFHELFEDTEKLVLQDAVFKGSSQINWFLNRMLQGSFRLVSYFSDGSRFGLDRVKENKYGCILFFLLQTKVDVKRFVIKPKEMRFYPTLHPNWSFFSVSTNRAFASARDLELLNEAFKYADADEQPDRTLSREGFSLPYMWSHEEEAERRIVLQFVEQFSFKRESKMYLFFRVSPFNFMDESARRDALAVGEEALKVLGA